jgi:predicted nucleic acid-binding protein
MTAAVIDASAAVEMPLNTPAGQALRNSIPAGAEEYVPEIFYAEVSGVLRRAEINGLITSDRAAVALDELLKAPVRRALVKPLLSEAWTMRSNVTVADALYVVLARHLGATLVTADVRLSKAPGLGVPVIVQ